ncbi:hypothetical protein AB0P21_33375 [Kribbella sp. NPDC056861]
MDELDAPPQRANYNSNSSTYSSSYSDDADVERVLERVLGDAARRYGIEV